MLRFLSTIAILLLLSTNSVQSQVVVELTIENQSVSGTDLLFDIYLTRAASSPGGDLFLGNADFILTFNAGNFASPTLTSEDPLGSFEGFNEFVSTNGNMSQTRQLYFGNTSPVSPVVGNEIKINLAGPAIANQSFFDSRIAKIDNTPSTYRLGRFRLSGISNPDGTADLMWKTTGGGSETKVFTYTTTTPWVSSQVDLIAINPPSALLPLELVAFTVRPLNATDAQLDWITASEINSSRFDIERSIQGYSWITIGTVAATGNSQSKLYYNWIDKKVFDSNEFTNTNFYYRLKIVDIEGHFVFSDVRQVKFESKDGLIVGDPFPNPSGLGNASVQLPVSIMGKTNLRIDVYNIQGSIVSTITSPLNKGSNKLTIGTGTLSLGVFFIKLTKENGESFVRKLMVQ